MARETELKYSISSGTFDVLRNADHVGPYHLEKAESREVNDVYADTSEGAIRNAGFAFRIRSRGDVRIACLKGLGRGGELEHSREEHEVQIGSAQSPYHWPDGETRDRFLEITRGEPLETEVEIRQTRIKRLLKSASKAVAEVSLDHVRFKNGGDEKAFFELEVELLSDEFLHILHDIHNALVTLYDLEPVEKSKFERAIAFRDALRE